MTIEKMPFFEWGSEGRKFESCRPDSVGTKSPSALMLKGFFHFPA